MMEVDADYESQEDAYLSDWKIGMESIYCDGNAMPFPSFYESISWDIYNKITQSPIANVSILYTSSLTIPDKALCSLHAVFKHSKAREIHLMAVMAIDACITCKDFIHSSNSLWAINIILYTLREAACTYRCLDTDACRSSLSSVLELLKRFNLRIESNSDYHKFAILKVITFCADVLKESSSSRDKERQDVIVNFITQLCSCCISATVGPAKEDMLDMLLDRLDAGLQVSLLMRSYSIRCEVYDLYKLNRGNSSSKCGAVQTTRIVEAYVRLIEYACSPYAYGSLLAWSTVAEKQNDIGLHFSMHGMSVVLQRMMEGDSMGFGCVYSLKYVWTVCSPYLHVVFRDGKRSAEGLKYFVSLLQIVGSLDRAMGGMTFIPSLAGDTPTALDYYLSKCAASMFAHSHLSMHRMCFAVKSSTDTLLLCQAILSAIATCADAVLQRQAYHQFKRYLRLHDDPSLFLLLQWLIQHCPFPQLAALLLDMVKECCMLSSTTDVPTYPEMSQYRIDNNTDTMTDEDAVLNMIQPPFSSHAVYSMIVRPVLEFTLHGSTSITELSAHLDPLGAAVSILRLLLLKSVVSSAMITEDIEPAIGTCLKNIHMCRNSMTDVDAIAECRINLLIHQFESVLLLI